MDFSQNDLLEAERQMNWSNEKRRTLFSYWGTATGVEGVVD